MDGAHRTDPGRILEKVLEGHRDKEKNQRRTAFRDADNAKKRQKRVLSCRDFFCRNWRLKILCHQKTSL